MKNSIFDSLFLVNLLFSLGNFLCVLKMYHVWLYIVEKWGLERLPDDVEFIPNLSFNAKNLPFIALWNPSNVRRSMPAYACVRPAYAYTCMHTQAKGFLGLYFPKINLFAHKTILTFPESI